MRRCSSEIRGHPARVISRTFIPDWENTIARTSLVHDVVTRVLAMNDDHVARTLASTLAQYSTRHDDLRATFRMNFSIVTAGLPAFDPELSQERLEVIGAYFTQEFSIEGAALFNPSIVEAPDQEGCPAGALRFIMSLRAVGEGHISSIEFRTGTLTQDDEVVLDLVSPHLSTGTRHAIDAIFLPHRGVAEETTVDTEDDTGGKSRELGSPTFSTAAGYQVEFAPTSLLSARVLVPGNPAESHGLEDARLVRFIDDTGNVTYFGTYNAYDGTKVSPQVFHTTDFVTFTMRPMQGEAAANKGMALFPRPIGGQLWCISRWDRESIFVSCLDDKVLWSNPTLVQSPTLPWDLVQLGACASPIETASGWLVLTHGVGPMRSYAIGALLLDLEDPTTALGKLESPLMVPAENERDGYVPNVVYTCGALVRGDTILLPYGCSDHSVRFAMINLAGLLDQLMSPSSDTIPHQPGAS